MIKDKIESLVALRFDSQVRSVLEQFLSTKAEMNAKGFLHSSITVQKCHAIIDAEFKNSAKIIVKSIVDILRESKGIANPDDMCSISEEILENRKIELENMLKSNVINDSGLQNKSMLAPYSNLDSSCLLTSQEMKVDLNRELEAFNKELGGSFRDVILNQFKNNKVIAIMSVVVIFFVTFAAFIKAIEVIAGAFK